MKPREYKITGIPNNSIIYDSINEVADHCMACALFERLKTHFDHTFSMNPEQLN